MLRDLFSGDFAANTVACSFPRIIEALRKNTATMLPLHLMRRSATSPRRDDALYIDEAPSRFDIVMRAGHFIAGRDVDEKPQFCATPISHIGILHAKYDNA